MMKSKIIIPELFYIWKKSLQIFSLVLIILIPSILFIYSNQNSPTTYLASLDLNLDPSFSKLNASRWMTPNFRNNSFVFEVESYDSNSSIGQNVIYSVEQYQMGTTEWFKSNSTTWGEWGYSFHHLTNGSVDGAGVTHYGGYPTTPNSKQAAYDYMKQYIINFTRYLSNDRRPWYAFNGHYPYHHYAAEFGYDAIGTEIGENIDSYQLMMAFNRGAARQYQLPWFVDVSAWFGNSITDSNVPSVWSVGGANNGHSLSLYERTYTMAYMAGTSRVVAEGGCYNLFYQKPDSRGLLPLTPLGEMARNFVNFTNIHPNRGVSYAPIGIYLDFLHGSNGIASPAKIFNTFSLNSGDKMSYDLFNLLFPDCWKSPSQEKGALTNNEFGDIFDVLLQNADSNVLNTYPVLLMSGDINLKSDEAARLVDYVEQGGTLIVNSAYFSALNTELKNQNLPLSLTLNNSQFVKVSSLENLNGGNFVLYGPDYNLAYLRAILQELIPLLMPFKLSSTGPLGLNNGDYDKLVNIQSIWNRNTNGWVLTLINNDGISKTPHEGPVIDFSERKELTIVLNSDFLSKTMQNQELSLVSDWLDNNVLWERGSTINQDRFDSIKINLCPGEIAVLEFRFS